MLVLGVLCFCLASVHRLPAQVQATDKPFLWRIDGPTPSYLYGTIHVPDARVLALPEVVRRAFDASDAFYAELPLNDATMQTAMSLALLPPDQNLRSLLGQEGFARLVNVVNGLMPAGAPPPAGGRFVSQLLPLKPWAAISMVQNLLFVPDVEAGRQPLDDMLYTMASQADKVVGGLETVEEQAGVFDTFTNEEQVRIFFAELGELETPSRGRDIVQRIIDLYLTGELDGLAAEMNKASSLGDPAIEQRLKVRMEDERNLRMADRITALCAKPPGRSHFFAVGAAHYIGETGLINQLTKKGFKISRLGPTDAAAIVRRPAA